jgi:Fe2+ transport system protein FeoA
MFQWNKVKTGLKYYSFGYWRELWIKAHFQHHHSFERCVQQLNGMLKLSAAKTGCYYKFISAYCNERLGHRLLEMGFVPGEYIKIVANTGSKGSVMVEVKGSKLALSHKIADDILLMESK